MSIFPKRISHKKLKYLQVKGIAENNSLDFYHNLIMNNFLLLKEDSDENQIL